MNGTNVFAIVVYVVNEFPRMHTEPNETWKFIKDYYRFKPSKTRPWESTFLLESIYSIYFLYTFLNPRQIGRASWV